VGDRGAHVGITRGGKVIHIHDFERLIVHGNGWELAVRGDRDGRHVRRRRGRSAHVLAAAHGAQPQPQSPTPELIESAKMAIRWIAAMIESHGGKLNAIVAHRQASRIGSRSPGSALWQAVALPMHQELKVTDGGVGFRIGTGYAIPEAWDPRCKGIRY